MGGDDAPGVVIEGAEIARERHPDIRFLMFGDEALISPMVEQHPVLAACTEIRHASEIVRNDDKPSVALRSARNSSMRLAIDAVRDGDAHCVISAGNTGALMAISKMVLKMLPGIERPAITGLYPTMKGESCMLDLGANVQCSAQNLVEFAVMGEAFARSVLGMEKPTIGLLNVGVEDMKGHEEIREAATVLGAANLPIEFKGFVEGDDITAGTVDVVVTDGFTGNIALKALEGTTVLCLHFLRESFKSSPIAVIGQLFSRRAMNKLKVRIDPRRYNGAIMLGLNGIVIKSHGGTDAFGLANAIGVGVDLIHNGCIPRMREDFDKLRANGNNFKSGSYLKPEGDDKVAA